MTEGQALWFLDMSSHDISSTPVSVWLGACVLGLRETEYGMYVYHHHNHYHHHHHPFLQPPPSTKTPNTCLEEALEGGVHGRVQQAGDAHLVDVEHRGVPVVEHERVPQLVVRRLWNVVVWKVVWLFLGRWG